MTETNTNVIEAFTDSQLATKAVILQQIMKLIAGEIKSTKAIATEQYEKGDGKAARANVDGVDTKLGKLSKSDPAKVATVTDYAAFQAHLRAEYPENLETEFELGETSEIIPVLLKHAPHLVTAHENVIPGWLESNELKLALSRPVPGVEVKAPAGVMSITTTAASEKLVRGMLEASPIPLFALPPAKPGEPA